MLNEQDSPQTAWCIQMAAESIRQEWTRPSVLYRPVLTQDGNEFVAVLGQNIQEGIVGCGDTPDKAMGDFDRAWFTKVEKP